MCRTGGRRCPSSRTPSRGGTRGTGTPGQQGDTAPGPAVCNVAAGNAHVGMQAGDVTITGDGAVIPGPQGDIPVYNVVTGNARAGRQAGGTPAGDTPGSGHVNVAAGNARVGVQASTVTITGGLSLGMPAGRPRPGPRPGSTAPAASSPGPVQQGTHNVAGTGDIIAVQAGRIHRRTPREGDTQP